MLKQNEPAATIRMPCHSTADRRVASIETML